MTGTTTDTLERPTLPAFILNRMIDKERERRTPEWRFDFEAPGEFRAPDGTIVVDEQVGGA